MPLKAKSYIKVENITPKIGIFEAGIMASYHGAGFRKAGAKIVGVVDSIPEVAKRITEKNNICKSCCSVNELLEHYPDLDAVSMGHDDVDFDGIIRELNKADY